MGRKVSVFLSYRRADTPYAAGRLGDRLGERFELFMDIDIAPGLHFGRALTDAVSSCDVMLVLIGPSWLTAMGEDGRRRLEKDQPAARVVQHRHHHIDECDRAGGAHRLRGRVDRRPRPQRRAAPGQRVAQLRGEPEGVTTASAATATARAGSSIRPELPISPQANRALLIVIGVSYLTLVVWPLPLTRPEELADALVPLVLLVAVTIGFLPTMWWGARHYPDRRHLWRSASLYAAAAVPVGLVLALVTKYVTSVNFVFWLLLYAVAMIPGGLAYAMVRPRHGQGALWAAAPAYLVAVSTLLISAVLLA